MQEDRNPQLQFTNRYMKDEVMTSALNQQAASETVSKPWRPQEALLSDMELPLRGIFYPLGYAVEIITNEPAVLEAANESFGHARSSGRSGTLQVRVGVSDGGGPECPPEPTRREYNHLYSLVA